MLNTNMREDASGALVVAEIDIDWEFNPDCYNQGNPTDDPEIFEDDHETAIITVRTLGIEDRYYCVRCVNAHFSEVTR